MAVQPSRISPESGASWIESPLLRWSRSPWIPWCFALGAGGSTAVLTAKLASRDPLLGLAAAAALVFPVAALLSGNLERFLLGVALFEIPLSLDVNLFYREEESTFASFGGLNLSVTTLCLLGLGALWFADRVDRAVRGQERGHLHRESTPLIVYVAVVGASIFTAYDAQLAAFEVFLVVQALMLFLYIAHRVKTPSDALFVLAVLLAGVVLQSLIMGGLRIVGHDVDLGIISGVVWPDGRVAGTLGSPNVVAAYLSLSALPALGILASRLSGALRKLAGAAFICGSAGLILTSSRGGWVTFLACASLMCVASVSFGWISPRTIVALAVTGVLLAAPFALFIYQRLTEDDRGSAYSRVPLMRIAGRMIRERPLIGIGANNFAAVMMDTRRYSAHEHTKVWLSTVHNKYLLVWAETGLLGLTAFLWFLIATLRNGWSVVRRRDPRWSPVALGLAGGVLANMLHMNVDIFNSRPQVQMLAVMAGLIVALVHLARDPQPETVS